MKRTLLAFAAGMLAAYVLACLIWPALWYMSLLTVYCFFKPMCLS